MSQRNALDTSSKIKPKYTHHVQYTGTNIYVITGIFLP